MAVLSSLSAREVFVSTLGQISAAESEEEQSISDALKSKTRSDGTPLYSAGTVAAILLFFAFALQCMSTVAVMRRETNSWKWPLTAFAGLLVIAYTAAFIGNRVFTMIAG